MIVTVEAHKGGVAKSTTAYFLAHSWASRGHRTLLIGTSPQNDLLNFLPQRHDIHGGLRELLAAKGHPQPFGVANNLQLLPAGYHSTVALTPPEIRDRLVNLAHDTGSDRVVIDGYNLVDLVAWGAVAAADLLIVPCTISPEPARAVHRLWKGLEAQRTRPETADLLPGAARVLLTDVPAPSDRTKGLQRLLDRILTEWARTLLRTQIRRSGAYVDLDEALDSYSGARRPTRGSLATDYQRLATEIDELVDHADPAR
jgi:cellulose biosynthesis protein BcsQ